MNRTKGVYTLPDFGNRREVTNRLKQIIFNVDLRNSFDGLYAVGKSNGADPDSLKVGEFIAFVNTSHTAVKFFASGSRAMGYFKMPGSRAMDLRMLQYLPRYFNGGALDWKGAVREAVETNFKLPK